MTPGRRPEDLWDRLSRAFDPGTFRPKLAEDVEIKEFRLRWGNDYAMIANPRDLIHYRLEPGELETVRLMDGARTMKEIVVERFQESGELELDGVADLVRQLREGGFLHPPFVNAYGAVRRAMEPSAARAKAREFFRTLSVEWTRADRLVRWLYHHGLRALFNRWVVVAGLAVGVLGLLAFIQLVRSGEFSLSGRSLAIEFLILGALNYFITFTHEMGHALGIVHYGRRIKSAGFMIYYGSPAWFIESSDILMLEPRQRIVQSFAGPVAEIMVAGVASVAVWLYPDALISSTVYKFAVLNYFIIFMNLVPLLELDGYYILSDAIHVPDLRPRSLAFIRHDLWHKLRIRERFSAQEAGLALYGILGVAFAIFSLYASFFFWRHLFGRLIVRMWQGGVVTRLLLVLLAVVIAGPLLRGLSALVRSGLRRARASWRRVRFRLEQGWRVEAAELIDALPLFDDLPVPVLNDLAGRVRLRTVARGQPVVRQGERPEAFYVVRRGTLHALE
jgi:putative peptide zinc metalloprotease protein